MATKNKRPVNIVSDMRHAIYVRKSSEDSGKQIQSIDNQLEVLREKALKENLMIVEEYIDEKSARKPRIRHSFNKLIEDIKAGKIDVILCWSPDRLARNFVDSGEIQHLLTQGILKQIKTYDRVYYPGDNSLFLNFEMGMATEYSLNLSKNVKRGQGFSVKKGAYPNQAPIGYMNSIHRAKGEKQVIPDPDRFPLVKRCWDLVLEGYSVPQVHKKSIGIGLTTVATKKRPSKPLSLNGMYTLLRNTFYFGNFKWSGMMHKGNHQAMVTQREFDRVQKLISKRDRPKKAKHSYPYRGLLICGQCGATITIAPKDKVRADGSINHRDYYRCTRRKSGVSCNQKSIRSEELESQIETIVNSIQIPAEFTDWAKKCLQYQNEEDFENYEHTKKQQRKRIDELDRQMSILVDMRIQEKLSEQDFDKKHKELASQKAMVVKELSSSELSNEQRVQKTVEVFEFCRDIQLLYKYGTNEDKDLVLTTLGSHYVLKDKKLDIVLKPHFELIQNLASNDWILNPRFPTLPTRIEKEFDVEAQELISNGGGAEVLPLGSMRLQR